MGNYSILNQLASPYKNSGIHFAMEFSLGWQEVIKHEILQRYHAGAGIIQIEKTAVVIHYKYSMGLGTWGGVVNGDCVMKINVIIV